MEQDVPAGTPRRDLLKKLGAGAAVVWVAPAVSSIPAHAQGSPGTPQPCDCANNPCGVSPINLCGQSPGGQDCVCANTTEGGCACFVPFCTGQVCSSTADCGAGFMCVPQCCGRPMCAPLCGTSFSPRGARNWTE